MKCIPWSEDSIIAFTYSLPLYTYGQIISLHVNSDKQELYFRPVVKGHFYAFLGTL